MYELLSFIHQNFSMPLTNELFKRCPQPTETEFVKLIALITSLTRSLRVLSL